MVINEMSSKLLLVRCFIFTLVLFITNNAHSEVRQLKLKNFINTGIWIYKDNDLLSLIIGGGTDRWPLPVKVENLQLISQLGPIDRLDVSYEKGFKSRDYLFLSKVKKVRELTITNHNDSSGNLMSVIQKCPGLEEFRLTTSSLTSGNLKSLKGYKNLKVFTINSPRLSHDHLNVITKSSKSIKKLTLFSYGQYYPTFEDITPLHNIGLNYLKIEGENLNIKEKQELRKLFSNCLIEYF